MEVMSDTCVVPPQNRAQKNSKVLQLCTAARMTVLYAHLPVKQVTETRNALRRVYERCLSTIVTLFDRAVGVTR